MERNVLSLYLSKVASGDETYLDKLCSRLAERLIYVPLVDSGDKKGKKSNSTKINVLKATHGDKVCVPVFTSEKKFKEWCAAQEGDFEVLSLLGVDFAAVVDPDAWLIVDPGSDHSVVLSPDTVDLISQELFIEVFESEKKMKERAAIELAQQMADVGMEPIREERSLNGSARPFAATPDATPKYEEINPFAEEPPATIAVKQPLEPDEPPQVVQPRGEVDPMEMWQPAGRRSRAIPTPDQGIIAIPPSEPEPIEPDPIEAAAQREEPVQEAPEGPPLEVFAHSKKIQQRDDEDDWSAPQGGGPGSGGSRVFSRDQAAGGFGMEEVNTTQEFPRVEVPRKQEEEPVEEPELGGNDGLMSLFRSRSGADAGDESEAPAFGGARVKPAADPRARGRDVSPEPVDLQRAKRNLFDPDESPPEEPPVVAAAEEEPVVTMSGFMGEPTATAVYDRRQISSAASEAPQRTRRPTMWQGSAENTPNDTAHRGLKKLREELAAGGALGEAAGEQAEATSIGFAAPAEAPARKRAQIASDTPDEPSVAVGRKAPSLERPRSGTGSFKRSDFPGLEEFGPRQRTPSSTDVEADSGFSRPGANQPSATGVFERPKADEAGGTGKFDRAQIEQAAGGFGRPRSNTATGTGVFNRPDPGASDEFEKPGRARKNSLGGFGEPPEDLSQTSSRPYSPRMSNGVDDLPPPKRSPAPQLPPDEITSTHEFAKPRVTDRRGSMGGTGMNLLEPNHAEKVYFPKDQKPRPGIGRPGVFGEVSEGEEQDGEEAYAADEGPRKKKSLFDFLKR